MPPAKARGRKSGQQSATVPPGCAHWGPGEALRTAQSWAVSHERRNGPVSKLAERLMVRSQPVWVML
jgi:hypothetical protein